MAAKFADYYVSAIDYNADGTHIAKLKVYPVDHSTGKFKKHEVMTRPEVIGLLNSGKTVRTMTMNADKTWKGGADLKVIPVTTEFLTTKKDNSLSDNLEKLPAIS